MSLTLTKVLSTKMALSAVVLFVIITVWWLALKPFSPDQLIDQKNLWSASYELLSLLGAYIGVIIARYWGGYKSILGRSILAFATGLFLQTFGQMVYNYYTLFAGIDAPYPSLGDVGYFGSIFAYLYGVFLLAKASGVRVSLQNYRNKLLAVLIPLIMLWVSYSIFLTNYEFDWSQSLKVFLDFGYPLGQAVYVSIAILTLLLSRNILGGLMRGPILAILIALIVQYCCDFYFLHQANLGVWYPGSIGDYFYAVSYLIMTLALVYIGVRFRQIEES